MFKKIIRGERGFGLIEALIAVALLGIIAAAFLTAIATASRAVLIADERTTAESLAKSQMEYIKAQDYIETGEYSTLPNIEEDYPSFSINMVAATLKIGLQKVTLVIYNNEDEIFTLEGYKVDRE